MSAIVGATLGETLLGFVTGCALAFTLGTVIALSRNVEYYLYPIIIMFQAMPKVALAPLILVWFGLGLTSKVVSAALIAFFPLMVNTIVGLRSADEDRVNLMRSLAASRWQIFRMLQLPNAMPYIFAGLEIAMIFSLIGAIVAELVGAERGLGMLMQSMSFTMDVAGQFSILFILSILGLILNGLVTMVRRRVLFWDPSRDRDASEQTATKGGVHVMQRLFAWGERWSGSPSRRARPPPKCRPFASAGAPAPSAPPAAPFAIATKMGWFEKDGIKVELVPLPGSTDCVKLVATKELQASLPSVEPLAIIRPQGVKAKFFYTAYQGNIYGLAVPADSTIKSITDLKGKKIGVTSMASAGVIVARALAKQAGMNPDTDITIVVAGESAQTAALLNSKQIDALSQFDTQYALTEQRRRQAAPAR